MDARLEPRQLIGTIRAIPSKSEAHRALICAALADSPTQIVCPGSSDDIDATIGCLEALGARIARTSEGFDVEPISRDAAHAPVLDCRESGSTLRFMLPVAAALGSAELTGAGRLSKRPLKPLADALRAHGAAVGSDGDLPMTVSGPLHGGMFELPGNVSSQYITGILLAAPLIPEPVSIRVSEPIESQPYVALTLRALSCFGVESEILHEEGFTCYRIKPGAAFRSPGTITVGGDWSNSSFWLAAGALSREGVLVEGLELASKQADRAVMGALTLFGSHVLRATGSTASRSSDLRAATIDVSSCPDLVPAIAPIAALAPGRSIICGVRRLRFKESDRLASISSALNSLGAQVEVAEDALVFEGVERFTGGEVDAANDHRIAMMAAIAATCADAPVIIHGAECVAKSYPRFFDDYAELGGSVILEG